jgi:hypothetical protein
MVTCRKVLLMKKASVKRDLAEEIDLLDKMITSLVELLEEKGILAVSEWEKRVKQNTPIQAKKGEDS